MSAIVVQAPGDLTSDQRRERDRGRLLSVFLAGGISGCADWQTSMVRRLSDMDVILYNPRRHGGFAKTGSEARKQIAWEAYYLELVDIVSFWFPGGKSLCPITLLELGKALGAQKTIVVGAAPRYTRRFDVIEQMGAVHRPVHLASTEVGLARMVRDEVKRLELTSPVWRR